MRFIFLRSFNKIKLQANISRRHIFSVVILLGIWYYAVNGTPKTNHEENALLKENSHLENKTSGVEDKGAEF